MNIPDIAKPMTRIEALERVAEAAGDILKKRDEIEGLWRGSGGWPEDEAAELRAALAALSAAQPSGDARAVARKIIDDWPNDPRAMVEMIAAAIDAARAQEARSKIGEPSQPSKDHGT